MKLFPTILCVSSLLLTAGNAAERACCAEVPAAKPVSALSLYQLDAAFTNDRNEPVALTDFRGKPIVLTMFFASCGYACPLLVGDMTRIRESLPEKIRGEVAFVLVSFDTERDTPAALAKYREERALDAQWHLLHGDADAISELAALLGVKYRKEANGMFSHSNLITVLNREGEIVHHRNGLQGGLEETAAALAASEGE